MTSTRQRNAWIWLAVAFMAVASLARVHDGFPGASAYSNSVLQFLSGQQDSGASAATGNPGLLKLVPASQSRMFWLHGAHSGEWMAVLPVFFIGLLAPLSLISPRSTQCLGRPPAAPALPSSFQRPPPSLLL